MLELFRTWLAALGAFLGGKILPTVIILIAGILAIRLLMDVVSRALEKSKLEKAAHSLVKSLLSTVLYVLLGLIVASKLGIDVTGIIALASVLTLAVSLAIQNALSNIIGGFTLLYTHPFHSGDYVEIAGQSGTVEEIGLTYTRLATADNKSVSIPNSTITSAQIINYTVLGTRRVDITVSASYDSPVDTVLACLLEAAQVPTMQPQPEPFAAVQEYGDSAIVYTLKLWSTAEDYWTTLFDTNKKIKEAFDAHGVVMTYPHLNVHLDR